MNSLSHIVSETFGHFLATTNVSIIGVCQKNTQERQRETMAAELVAGTSQLRFIPFDAQGSELCTSIPR
jgi:hypothetical protein